MHYATEYDLDLSFVQSLPTEYPGDGPKGDLNYEFIFHLGLFRIKTACLNVGITEFILKKLIL